VPPEADPEEAGVDDFFSVLAAAGAGVELEPESLAEALEALDELPDPSLFAGARESVR
jgi:hypothetical protein